MYWNFFEPATKINKTKTRHDGKNVDKVVRVMEKWWLLPLVPPILGTILAFSFPIAIGVILTSLMMAPAILVIVYFVFRQEK